MWTSRYDWQLTGLLESLGDAPALFVIQSEAKNLGITAQPKVHVPEILRFSSFRSG